MHMYSLDGIEYPSVTTIISLISTNNELMKWANHMGFKHKDIGKIQDDVTSFGTLVHAHLRSVVDPLFLDAPEYKDNLQKYQVEKVKSNFKLYFKDVEYETIYTEKTIISKELKYAGTLDWLSIMSGYRFLNDFKTSKTPHDTMFLQLGGYYNLLQTIGEDVDYASIIIANVQRCAMYPITKNQLVSLGQIFNILKDFYINYAMEFKISPEPAIVDKIKTSS